MITWLASIHPRWRTLALATYFTDHGKRCTRCGALCNYSDADLEIKNGVVMLVHRHPCSPPR